MSSAAAQTSHSLRAAGRDRSTRTRSARPGSRDIGVSSRRARVRFVDETDKRRRLRSRVGRSLADHPRSRSRSIDQTNLSNLVGRQSRQDCSSAGLDRDIRVRRV